jgi:hypothetical protein
VMFLPYFIAASNNRGYYPGQHQQSWLAINKLSSSIQPSNRQAPVPQDALHPFVRASNLWFSQIGKQAGQTLAQSGNFCRS